MRKILFRGQTRRYGEKVMVPSGEKVPSNWVYGGILPQNNGGDKAIIYQQEPEIKKFPVYNDTVGQFTGLIDRNGKMIFEGDIVQITGDKVPRVVIFEQGYFGLQIILGTSYDKYGKVRPFKDEAPLDIIEVIGNIFDNPELLKEV